MKNKLEIPIGVTAEVFGKTVICEQTTFPCENCTFGTFATQGDDCNKIACYANERDDEKYIIFKELKV